MNQLSIEEAKKVIEQFPNEDCFISENVRGWTGTDGEFDDNSIELSDYYRECQSIIAEFLHQKHG